MSDFLAAAWPYAAAVLVVLGIAVLVFLVIILYRASKAMESVQNIAQTAEKEVTPALAKVNPIVDKAELMVDTVNLEMLRVDAILEDVEQVTDVAGKAATTVDTITSAPADAVTSIVDRVRGTLGSKRNNKKKQERLVYPIGAPESEKDAGARSDESDLDDAVMKEAAKILASQEQESSAEDAKPSSNGDAGHSEQTEDLSDAAKAIKDAKAAAFDGEDAAGKEA